METEEMDFYWKLGSRIRTLRQVKKYSVDELAEKANISTKYLYQIENGKVRFSTEIFCEISKALGVATSVLVDEESMDIGKMLLFELTGKFTGEEKEYIRKIIMKELIEKNKEEQEEDKIE